MNEIADDKLYTILRSAVSDHTVRIHVADEPIDVTFENYRSIVEDSIADTMVSRSSVYQIYRRCWREPVKTAVVIRFLGLGDVLLTTPLLRYLHQTRGWVIDYITTPNAKQLLTSNMNVRNIFEMEAEQLTKELYTKMRHKYDAVIDLRFWVEREELGRGSRVNRTKGFFSAIDINPETVPQEASLMEYYCTDEERLWAKDFIGKGHDLTCAFVWESSSQNKDWKLDQKTAVLKELVSLGFKVFIVGGLDVDFAMKGVRNVAKKISLRETAAIIAETGVIISPDTGLMHIAQALKRPVVSYIGSFPVEMRASSSRNLSIVNTPKKCEKHPCFSFFCEFVDTDKENLCLSIDPQNVANEALRIHSRMSSQIKELVAA